MTFQEARQRVEELERELERFKVMTAVTIGVGDGAGRLFVHGDAASIEKICDYQEEILRLRAELAEVRKDAERYRCLRNSLGPTKRTTLTMPMVFAPSLTHPYQETYLPEGLDMAIDAAISAQQQGEEE